MLRHVLRAVAPHVTHQDVLAFVDLEANRNLPNGWAPPQARVRFGPGSCSHAPSNQEFVMWALGTVAIRQSLEFKPQLKESVVEAVLYGIVPQAVLPIEGDTAQSLAGRIADAKFFDELYALVAGGSRGSKRVRLNETTYSQTRRIAWSAVVEGAHTDGDGETVWTMYAYGKGNSRIRTDVMATPMPWAIFELGVQCFLSVRHVLTEVCASSPPNHCQMLAYYALFDSKCGRHKDDHEKSDFHEVLLGRVTAAEAVNRSKGAMLPGSDVLIYSAGPLPVVFSWCFTRDNPGHFVPRESYEIHPYMQIDLPHGSVFVFKAFDDLHFYHEVSIALEYAQPTDHRFAFVFRWLGEAQQQDFLVASGANEHDDSGEACTSVLR